MGMHRPEPMMRNPLDGRRVLVVEDDFVTAFDLKAELENTGVEVVRPVPDLTDAMDLIALGPAPDAAILDINLGGEMVFPLPDRLREHRVLFVFVTGYECSPIPEPYARPLCLERPVDMQRLAQALMRSPVNGE